MYNGCFYSGELIVAHGPLVHPSEGSDKRGKIKVVSTDEKSRKTLSVMQDKITNCSENL